MLIQLGLAVKLINTSCVQTEKHHIQIMYKKEKIFIFV